MVGRAFGGRSLITSLLVRGVHRLALAVFSQFGKGALLPMPFEASGHAIEVVLSEENCRVGILIPSSLKSI